MCDVTIKGYTIPRFCMNVEQLSKGEHKFSLNMNANILIPKDAENKECIVEIVVSYNEEEDCTVLDAMVRGRVEVDESLSDVEKCDLIKEHTFPVFYTKLRNFIGETIDKTYISLPNIPQIEDVEL